jgi:hypothetical protein
MEKKKGRESEGKRDRFGFRRKPNQSKLNKEEARFYWNEVKGATYDDIGRTSVPLLTPPNPPPLSIASASVDGHSKGKDTQIMSPNKISSTPMHHRPRKHSSVAETIIPPLPLSKDPLFRVSQFTFSTTASGPVSETLKSSVDSNLTNRSLLWSSERSSAGTSATTLMTQSRNKTTSTDTHTTTMTPTSPRYNRKQGNFEPNLKSHWSTFDSVPQKKKQNLTHPFAESRKATEDVRLTGGERSTSLVFKENLAIAAISEFRYWKFASALSNTTDAAALLSLFLLSPDAGLSGIPFADVEFLCIMDRKTCYAHTSVLSIACPALLESKW